MRPIQLVTVFGGPCDVLEDWLLHYDSLGVDRCTIHVQGNTLEDTQRLIARINAVRGQTPRTVLPRIEPWSFHYNTRRFAESKSLDPAHWYVYADQDEFQVWPAPLRDVLHECDRRGYEYVEGAVLDMTAASLRPETRDPQLGPIWRQYPVAQLITGPVMRSCMGKVVACLGRVSTGHGQHQAHHALGCEPSDVYVPVHHFKWTQHVETTTAARVAAETPNVQDAHQRLQQHLAEHDGRLRGLYPDVFYPALTYAHWPRIVDWRMRANYFSLHLMHQAQRRVRLHPLDLPADLDYAGQR